MTEETVREYAEKWVNGLNSIPTCMIRRLMELEPTTWREVTKPVKGTPVAVFDPEVEDTHLYGNVVESYLPDLDTYKVELENHAVIYAKARNVTIDYWNTLPLSDIMWSFRYPNEPEREWLSADEGLYAVSECGFRIFKSEDFGYVIGFNEGDPDSFEKHWISLYKARFPHVFEGDEEERKGVFKKLENR